MIESINPATEEIIKNYELMNDEQISQILHHSYRAYENWRNTSLDQRIELFRQLGETLRSKKEEYGRLMTREMGKPISQAIAEVEKCAWTCDVYADNVKEWLKEELVEADGKEHRVIYQPLGVILSVMPWNFPFWQVFRFAIPSLIVGNTAILKHSNAVPGCAVTIEQIFNDAGFPEFVFQTILADHHQVEDLIGSDMIAGVSLTGSTGAGKRIAELAGKHLKKVVLELGGSDPFIVFDDVDLDVVIPKAITGRMQNNAQSCIAAKRFFVHENIIDEFIEQYAEAVNNLKIGDPQDEETDIGPLANHTQLKTVIDQLENAKAKGGKVITGGNVPDQPGYYFHPAIVSNVNSSMKVLTEEVFGPVAPIISFSSEDEVIEKANSSEFGLGGSVWTRDLERGERVARRLAVGTAFVNSIVKSDPRMPFGGIKQSGLGRELSKYGLKEFVNTKGINIYEHQ